MPRGKRKTIIEQLDPAPDPRPQCPLADELIAEFGDDAFNVGVRRALEATRVGNKKASAKLGMAIVHLYELGYGTRGDGAGRPELPGIYWIRCVVDDEDSSYGSRIADWEIGEWDAIEGKWWVLHKCYVEAALVAQIGARIEPPAAD